MESNPLSPPGSIGLLLRRAHRRAARAFAAQLQPLGIDNRQAGVLLQLGQAGLVTQRQLIDLMGSDKSSMVRTVDDLEARGLAQRKPHPHDRRAHAVEITPAGRELLARVRTGADRAGVDLLGCLEPEQREQLHALLTLFVQAPDPVDSHDLPDRPSS